MIISLSANVTQGYAGIVNLGLYLPIVIGAMVVGFFPSRMAMILYGTNSRLDFVYDNPLVLSLLRVRLQDDTFMSISLLMITILIAMAISASVGYLAAYPALRLPATYLAVFYLALAESLRVIGMYNDYIAGGVIGVNIISPFWWLGDNAYAGTILFILGVTIIVAIAISLMCSSPFGRSLRAMRDNELTAKCVGKNVPAIKKKTLALTFSFLSLAGVLHAYYMGDVFIGGYTRTDFSFYPWLMMLIGGTGNNLGVTVGALFLVLLRRAITILKQYLPALPFNVMFMEPILMGIMLLLVIILRPGGLLPAKPSSITLPRTDA